MGNGVSVAPNMGQTPPTSQGSPCLNSALCLFYPLSTFRGRPKSPELKFQENSTELRCSLSGKWLVSTNGLDPPGQYLHGVSSVERGWLSGAPDCSRPQLCVGSEPTDPAPPLELQNAPHPHPNNRPPASAYTVRGQRTTWVSLGLSEKHCEPDINSLPAATVPWTPLCLLPCWTCGSFGNPRWPLLTPLFPDRPSADVCFPN